MVPTSPRHGRGLRWVVAQSLLMSALVAAGPWHPGDWHSPGLVALGALLFVAAGVVGVTGVLHLGDNRTPLPSPRPGSRLVTRGIYAHLRHPLYTSVLTAGFAWTLLWQSTPCLLLALLQVPFFVAKARAEEVLLRAHFPEYEAYARRVRRFLPGVL